MDLVVGWFKKPLGITLAGRRVDTGTLQGRSQAGILDLLIQGTNILKFTK